MIWEFLLIKDGDVKQAIKDFRNGLKEELKDVNTGEKFDFNAAATGENGKCWIDLFRYGTKIFEEVGKGQIRTSDVAVQQFNNNFTNFENCMGQDMTKDKATTTKNSMANLLKQYADALIQKKQQQNGNQQQKATCPILKRAQDYFTGN